MNGSDQPFEPVLDLEAGLAKAGGDRGIQIRMLSIFMEELPGRMDGLAETLRTRDYSALKGLAHSLKSTSAVIGAMAASRAARELEAAAASGDEERSRNSAGTLILALVDLEARLREVPGVASPA